MALLFTNILIPVDVSGKAEPAIQKAIELGSKENLTIHLFHAINCLRMGTWYAQGHFFNSPAIENRLAIDANKKLQTLKDSINKGLPLAKVIIHTAMCNGIQRQIIELANWLKNDLIILTKNTAAKLFSFFNNTLDSNRIAQKTNSVVLTVNPGGLGKKIRSVVIPVRSFIPKRKIDLLSAINVNARPKILLAALYDKGQRKTNVFINTYRIISEEMNYPVEHKIFETKNFPKAILDYATHSEADMIFANPYAETRISSFYGTDICDIISPGSKLAVLTAEPFKKAV